MKELEKKISILNDNTIITQDNIIKLSQILALRAVKNMKKYAYDSIEFVNHIRKKLQQDIYYHSQLDTYSQAYDLVQEASLFLLKHLGQRVGDKCTIVKNCIPKTIPISFACIKEICTYLRKEMKHGKTEDDELLEIIPAKETIEENEDYTKVDNIISQLASNELEQQILNYCFNGVEVNDIAEFLNISIWKIYKRRTKFRQRYNSIFR